MQKHNFKKQFGQNFLIDEYYSMTLVKSAKLTKDDIVIEIGAGQGIVTKEIAKYAKQVYALDIDSELIGSLKTTFVKQNNVAILNEDILKWDFNSLIGESKYKVISSLPYNIAKKIIKIFLTNNNQPQIISVIIQKEVADNYLAKAPKTTFLGLYASLFSDMEFIENIPPYAFFPEPKVESTIMTFFPHKSKFNETQKLIKFIKAGFSNPRKMLVNNLQNYLLVSKETIQKAFIKTDLNQNSRPENLSVENWNSIFEQLVKQ